MNIFNILIQSLVSEGDWMTLSDHPGLCGLSLVLGSLHSLFSLIPKHLIVFSSVIFTTSAVSPDQLPHSGFCSHHCCVLVTIILLGDIQKEATQ